MKPLQTICSVRFFHGFASASELNIDCSLEKFAFACTRTPLRIDEPTCSFGLYNVA